jgi:hypothetical protein
VVSPADQNALFQEASVCAALCHLAASKTVTVASPGQVLVEAGL